MVTRKDLDEVKENCLACLEFAQSYVSFLNDAENYLRRDGGEVWDTECELSRQILLWSELNPELSPTLYLACFSGKWFTIEIEEHLLIANAERRRPIHLLQRETTAHAAALSIVVAIHSAFVSASCFPGGFREKIKLILATLKYVIRDVAWETIESEIKLEWAAAVSKLERDAQQGIAEAPPPEAIAVEVGQSATASPADPASVAGVSPSELATQLSIDNRTLNRYAKGAGVQTPEQGKRDHKYTAADQRKICIYILEHVTGEKVKAAAERLRAQLPSAE